METRVNTLSELKTIRFGKFDKVFCKETAREYYLEENGGSLTPDDIDVVLPAQGGNWRLVAQQARYINAGFAYAIGEYVVEYTDSEDVTTGLFPSNGGTGPAGAIKKGNSWVVTAASAGTQIDGVDVENGDTIVALVDDPGQDAGSWLFMQGNIGYTAENSANKSQSLNAPSSVQYPSTQAVRDYYAEEVVTAGNSIENGIDLKTPVVAPAEAMSAGQLFHVEVLVHFFITSGVSVPTWGMRKILAMYWCDGLSQRSYSAQVIASENSVESLASLTVEAALSTADIIGVPCLRINNDTGQALTYKMISRYTKSTTLAGNNAAAIAENFYYPAHMVGRVIYHAGATALPGTVIADGTLRSRAAFRRLFAKIGTTWGVGDGSTTFGTPDHRGLVMVGAGAHGTMTRANGTAYNGGSVGASRNDQMQGHRHSTSQQQATTGITSVIGNGSGSSSTGSVNDPTTDGTNGTPRTGDETRPAEIALLPCLVY